jgi:uncharacterized protein
LSAVLDTSVALALYDRTDDDHARITEWYSTFDDELWMTPMIVTELDHLIRQRGGSAAQRLLWTDLERGAYSVRWWSSAMTEILVIARDRPTLGLADASVIALARMMGTDRIAALDRHYRTATAPGGGPFTLLPADDA